jgi:DNA-dependent RNA polymerase auxiliary subunit epsilon
MEIKTGIYGLIDPNTFKIRYVGSSINIDKRYRTHCVSNPENYPSGLRDWLRSLRLGNQTPGLVILKTCTKDELGRYEVEFITSLKDDLLNLNSHKRSNPVRFSSDEERLEFLKEKFKKAQANGIKYYMCVSKVNSITQDCQPLNNDLRRKCYELIEEIYGETPRDLWLMRMRE